MSEIFPVPPEITKDEVWRRALSGSVPQAAPADMVNHPPHYTQYQGLEVIDLIEQMNLCKGNAVKYIARAGFKNPDTEVEDLEKAIWYLQREIERLTRDTPEGIDRLKVKLSTQLANLKCGS